MTTDFMLSRQKPIQRKGENLIYSELRLPAFPSLVPLLWKTFHKWKGILCLVFITFPLML